MVNPTGAKLGYAFLALDWVLRRAEPFYPKRYRRHGIDKAVEFVTKRLNGEDGLGGIFPAMANTVMAFHTLGYADDHPHYEIAASRSASCWSSATTKPGASPACPLSGIPRWRCKR